jgi:hypothetical protein
MARRIPSYVLYDVNENNFLKVFNCAIHTEAQDFEQHDLTRSYHFRYFSNYLCFDNNGLKTKTILVENKYTSQTYLDDYKNYYSLSYTNYGKYCKRIHFFSEKLTKKKFNDMLLSEKKGKYKKEWNSYLGCIVVKPLPKGIIGVTYLKTYNETIKNRKYLSTNTQTINLFGKNLYIETMPYLEQDGLVGSCASSALWMAFQKTSELFHTMKPSPSEITILAGYDSYNTGKVFPSKGLEISQICKSIYNTGLISELRQIDSDSYNITWLKGFIYSYLMCEIPVLMGVEIEKDGFHLITLNGFRFNDTSSIEPSDSTYRSDCITKFYAHDDQTGPFSRLQIQDDNDKLSLLTSWWNDNNGTNVWNKIIDEVKINEIIDNPKIKEIKKYFKSRNNYYKSTPYCIIVPLDRVIRVTFEDIYDKVEIIKFLTNIFLGIDFVWDIYLTKSNNYKYSILKETRNKNSLKNILFESLPKYIWVVKAYYSDEIVFDFIFDSMEMPSDGKPFLSNIYSVTFSDCIELADIEIRNLFNCKITNSLYKFLVDNTNPLDKLYEQYQDSFDLEKTLENSDSEAFSESIKESIEKMDENIC